MATCAPGTLLSDGAGFQALADHGLTMVTAELIREWAGSSDTPASLLSQGTDFQTLSSEHLDICIAQLLCEIAGGA